MTNSHDNEIPGYGSTCLINSDCQYTTAHLECFRGTCVCLEGYVPLGKYLCYNLRGQSKQFQKIYPMIEIYFQVQQMCQVQLSYLLYSVQHQNIIR